jgi:hypothetical protein
LSSSAIGNIYVRGLSGPDGNPGNTGNTGNTGSTGSTGNTGSLGAYYTGYVFNGNSVTITLSNGTTFELTGTFKGATTLDKGIGVATGSNTGSGQILLSSVAGGTFLFKGLCAYGSLRASYTGANNEYISIDSIYFGTDQIGNVDPTTLSARELIYLSTKVLGAGADLTHRTDLGINGICGAFDFAYTTYGGASSDTSNHLNTSSKILNLGPIPIGRVSGLTSTNVIVPNGFGTTLGVFLDAGAAGTFVCKTPIGIQGITGPFKKNEVASVSILIDSDNVWKFPSNVYFEPDQNYLSCGKNLIGLFTYDGGETWIASVSHRGHGIFNPRYQCIPGYLYGSCCYQTASGRLTCDDYVTRQQCDNVFGIFHPGMPCQEACGNDVSVCCTNGKCTENISITECESFGGSYWAGYTCGFAGGTLNYPEGDLNETQLRQQGRFCYDNCNTDDVAVCCKNGQCLGNYTRVQCELILGGRSANANSCDGIDCCDYIPTNAACCICTTNPDGSVTSTCEFLSYEECNSLSGNYMGPGKQCNDVACGCICGDTVTQPTGTCCKGTQCLTSDGNITQAECSAQGGSWTQGGNCTNCEVPSGPGICCVKNSTTGEGECGNFTTKESCEANCGHWIDYIVATSPVQGGGPIIYQQETTESLFNKLTAPVVRYNFGQDLTRECEICKLHRPVISENNGGCSYVRNTFKVPFYEKVCNNEITTPNGIFGVFDFVFGDRSGYKIPLFLNRPLDQNNPVTLLNAIIDSSVNSPSSFDCDLCGTMPASLDAEFMSLPCSDIKTNYLRYWFRNIPGYLRETFGTPCEGVDSDGNSVTHNYVFRECCGPNSTSIFCTPCQDTESCRSQNTPEDDSSINNRILDDQGCNVCECGPIGNCPPNRRLLTCGPASVAITTNCCEVKQGSTNNTGDCIQCVGLGSIDPNNQPAPSCPENPPCTPIHEWCNGEPLPNSLRCSCTPSSLLKTIKVTINNQEIYLPILCNSNCDDFETVE